MRIDFPNSTALLEHAQEKQLYGLLLVQLQKDLNLANIDFVIGPEVFPSQLKTLLHEKIYYLLLEKFTEYLNLLYIVDVPESAFKKIQMTDAVEVAEQVTFLILRREFEKVFWKMKS